MKKLYLSIDLFHPMRTSRIDTYSKSKAFVIDGIRRTGVYKFRSLAQEEIIVVVSEHPERRKPTFNPR